MSGRHGQWTMRLPVQRGLFLFPLQQRGGEGLRVHRALPQHAGVYAEVPRALSPGGRQRASGVRPWFCCISWKWQYTDDLSTRVCCAWQHNILRLNRLPLQRGLLFSSTGTHKWLFSRSSDESILLLHPAQRVWRCSSDPHGWGRLWIQGNVVKRKRTRSMGCFVYSVERKKNHSVMWFANSGPRYLLQGHKLGG